MAYFAQLIFGALFGIGLAVAGMTSPLKVLSFLDVLGEWDPSLLFVLGGAVLFGMLSFYFILRRSQPVLVSKFHVPTNTQITKSLVVGSALFGAGWGISGYCPGPALTLILAPFNAETLPVLSGLILGLALSVVIDKLQAK